MHRRFNLVRHEDITGVSGTGIVAEGVAFSSGKAVLEWVGKHPTSVVWHQNGIQSIRQIHGHNGATTIEWIDPLLKVKRGSSKKIPQCWTFEDILGDPYGIYIWGNRLMVVPKDNFHEEIYVEILDDHSLYQPFTWPELMEIIGLQYA